MNSSLLLFGLALTTGLRAQVPIPQFQGPVPADEVRYVRGMQYAPSDMPLRWLPDGRLILLHLEQYNSADVFASTCGGSGVYAVDTSGRSAPEVLSVGRPACDAAQSQDGATFDPLSQSLVYPVRVNPNNSRLVRLHLPSARLDTLQAGCAIYHEDPAFSPDGRLIATDGLCRTRDGSYEIYLMNADGTGLHRVGGVDTAAHTTPSWSPDASRLVFVRSSGSLKSAKHEIVIVDSAGNRPLVIGQGLMPSWSPNGVWVAFFARDTDRRGEYEIRLVRPNGADQHTVLRNRLKTTFSRGWGPMFEGQLAGSLVWSSDGKELAFTRAFDRGSAVWAVDIRTGESRPLTASSRASVVAPATPNER
jgi:Tol biopolymer transport system component